MHFGIRTTSRVEGAHSVAKQYIGSSSFGFFDLFEKLQQLINRQLEDFKAKHSDELSKKPIVSYSKVLSPVLSKISSHALFLSERSGKLENECTGLFSKIFGVPCNHRLHELQSVNQEISIDDFDKQWHLDSPLTVSIVSPPMNPKQQLESLIDTLQPFELAVLAAQLKRKMENFGHLSLKEPSNSFPKGRQKGSSKSTKRNPSHFEYVIKEKKRESKKK